MALISSLLANEESGSEIAKVITQNGGLELIDKVLQRYPTNENIVIHASNALSSIALNNPEAKEKIEELGLAETLKKIAENPDNAGKTTLLEAS
mmetsp:Transcript_15295/g.12988  ORF Transcript_15295/g.12988 Transcript_15295/m.12988 type:complete len:94 (+) Transcript_15295:280-561(+)